MSCEELDQLVETAGRSAGCAGARMMGGGFGGCTLNLVRGGATEEFRRQVGAELERRTGAAPRIHLCRTAAGASTIVHGSSGRG